MINSRVRFQKTGSVRYISHLDLNRAMARAIVRAGIDIWYTEGFNPHPFLVFGPPLSVGYYGDREIMDIRLMSEISSGEIRERLNAALPADLSVLDVYPAARPLKEIAYAEYDIYFESDGQDILPLLERLQAKEHIFAEKKNKSGIKQMEITRYIVDIHPTPADAGYRFTILLPCSNTENINPALLLNTMKNDAGMQIIYSSVTRKQFLDEKKNIFL